MQRYEIRCECGAAHSVSQGSAGASLQCDCGHEILVPSLAELRTSVGLSAIPQNAADVVNSKVESGLLPIPNCHCCHATGGNLMPLVAICEIQHGGSNASNKLPTGIILAVAFAVLISFILQIAFIWFLVLLTWMKFKSIAPEKITQLGRDVYAKVPIVLCSACRHRFPAQILQKMNWWLKVLCAIAGVALSLNLHWRWLSWILLPAAVLFHVLEDVAKDRYHAAVRRFLTPVPDYAELFEKYPRALVGIPSPTFP